MLRSRGRYQQIQNRDEQQDQYSAGALLEESIKEYTDEPSFQAIHLKHEEEKHVEVKKSI